MRTVAGFAAEADRDADIVIFVHSLIGFDVAGLECRGVRLVRDPRDVWVSGYLYHTHCSEKWCTNEDFDVTAPIVWPRVPKSQQHRSERWKRKYLKRLGGKSYQQNLLELDQTGGLAFELRRYARWTIKSMCAWRPSPSIVDYQMERLSTDFDSFMGMLFDHLGLKGEKLDIAMSIAARHDVTRMSDAQIAANDHIHSRELSKWRGFLQADDVALYESRFAGASTILGYAD